ncbi:hypothetical protein VTO73DRAFT_5332 [Trametes versicolor]
MDGTKKECDSIARAVVASLPKLASRHGEEQHWHFKLTTADLWLECLVIRTPDPLPELVAEIKLARSNFTAPDEIQKYVADGELYLRVDVYTTTALSQVLRTPESVTGSDSASVSTSPCLGLGYARFSWRSPIRPPVSDSYINCGVRSDCIDITTRTSDVEPTT